MQRFVSAVLTACRTASKRAVCGLFLAVYSLAATAQLSGGGPTPGVPLTISPPGSQVCTATPTAGPTNLVPGTYGNPQRDGTGWHVEAVRQNVVGVMMDFYNFYWLTFDTTRRPVWFHVGPLVVPAGATEIEATHIYRYFKGEKYSRSTVGEFAATFIPSRPNQIAIAWTLDDVSAAGVQQECIVDYLRPALAMRGSSSPTASHGLWRFDTSEQFAMDGVLISSFPTMNGQTEVYQEIVNPLLFDFEGNPVWLAGARQIPRSTYDATQSYAGNDITYRYSNYNGANGGVPLTNCANGASPPCYTVVTGSISLSRSFNPATNSAAGSFAVSGTFSHGTGTQQIEVNIPQGTWYRDPPPAFVTPARYFCAIPSGSPDCKIRFDWAYPQRPSNSAWIVRLVLQRNSPGVVQDILNVPVLGTSGFHEMPLTATSLTQSYRVVLTSQNTAAGEPQSIVATSPNVTAQGASGGSGVGPPASNTCSASSAAPSPLTSLIVPGLYRNMARPDTGWSLGFDFSNGQPALQATWFTFDAQGRPSWLFSSTGQISGGTGDRTVSAPLIRRRFILGPDELIDDTVGAVSFRLRNNDPRRVAVRWALFGTPGDYQECLENRFEAQTLPVVSPALAGIWAATVYPNAIFSEAYGQDASGNFRGQRHVRWFDLNGNPVWLRTPVVDLASVPPMNGAFLPSEPLEFVISAYPGGVPTGNCPTCPGATTQVGSLMRGYDDPVRGRLFEQVTFNNAQVQLPTFPIPPSTANPNTQTDIRKQTNVDSVHVSPQSCDLTAGPCQISIGWDSQFGQARLYRIKDNGTPVQFNNENQGSEQFNITDPGVYRFELRRFPNEPASTLLALSASVTVSGSPPPTATGRDWENHAPDTPPTPGALNLLPDTGSIPAIEVGSTPANFQVDETGAATYTIPLMTAPATAGFAPSVAIQYRSSAGDGPMGLGFSINGLSSIARCRKSFEHGDGPGPHPPVSYTLQDAYCMDGQRILEVSAESTGGQYVRKYRTEIDSYSNIISYSASSTADSPIYWRVWTKDGRELFYGLSAASAGVAPCFMSDLPICNGRIDHPTNGKTHTWLLSKARNRAQLRAVIEYGYLIAPNEAPLIKQIRYSGTDDGVANGFAPTARLVFNYDTESLPLRSYSAGMAFNLMKRLQSIVSSNADGQLIRQYNLEYRAQAIPNERPLLAGIREVLGASSYPKTTFNWSQRSIGFAAPQTETPNAPFPALRTIKPMNRGDGLTSFLYSRVFGGVQKLYAVLPSATASGELTYSDPVPVGSGAPGQFTIPNSPEADKAYHLFDFNHDGIDDLLLARCPGGNCATQPGQWQLYLGTADKEFFALAPVALPTPLLIGTLPSGGSALDAMLADVNGDGLADFIAPQQNLPNNRTIMRVHLQRRATANFACDVTGMDPINCPYEFAPAVDISLSLASNSQSFEVAFPKYEAEDTQLADLDSDGLVDLLMRVCTSCPTSGGYGVGQDPERNGVLPEAPEALRSPSTTQEWYWVVFRNDGIQNGVMAFREVRKWRTSGPDSNGIQAEATASSIRFGDLNSDGAADILFKRRQGAVNLGWQFILGDGTSFGLASATEQCVLEIGEGCNVFGAPQFMDGDGDGDMDLIAVQNVGFGDRRYQMLRWLGDGYQSPDPNFPNFNWVDLGLPNILDNDLTHLFLDLDNDGQFDLLRIKLETLNAANGRVVVTRRATDARHVPGTSITDIVNGLGAVTSIEYASLMMGDMYDIDGNGPWTASGRGTAVQDLIGPLYLAHRTVTSAPTAANPNGTVAARYRYVGGKIQGSGRGFLGYRKRLVLDESTGIQVTTETGLGFPQRGASSKSSRLASIPSRSCLGVDRDLGVCRAGTSRYCATALNSNCDRFQTEPSLNMGLSSTVMQGNFPTTIAFPLRLNSQQPIRYQSEQTTKTSFHLFENQNAQLSSVDVMSKYINANGNVYSWSFLIYTRNYAQIFWRKVVTGEAYFGGASAYPDWIDSVVNSSAEFQDGSYDAEGTSSQRDRFEANQHDIFGNRVGSRVTQSEENNNSTVKKFTKRNSLGNVILSVSCSDDFTESACTNHTMTAGNPTGQIPVLSGMDYTFTDPLRFRRGQSFRYDTKGRFVEQTLTYRNSGSSTAGTASGRVDGRNVWGAPTQSTDANGIVTQSRFTPLGSPLTSFVPASGSATVTQSNWCASQAGMPATVQCPIGAVYRVRARSRNWQSQTSEAVAPTTWAYYDRLGRELLSVRQGFAPRSFYLTSTWYDALGRVEAVSEPHEVLLGVVGANVDNLIDTTIVPRSSCGSSSVFCTRTSYDFLGRVLEIVGPDDTPSRPVRTTYRYSVGTCAGVESTSTADCLINFVTDPEGRISKEVRAPITDDLVSATDAAGLTTTYINNLDGNLVEVRRRPTPSAPEIVTTISYDTLGRRISMMDEDTGLRTFAYNALGEVIRETTANGTCTVPKYDVNGRVIQRDDFLSSACNGTVQSSSTWTFDVAPNGIGQLASEGDASGFSRTFTYDSLSRPIATVTNIDGESYRQEATYDQFGRPFQNFDLVFLAGSSNAISPSQARKLGVRYIYNTAGYQTQIRNALNGANDIFYEVTAMDARGQVVQSRRSGSAVMTSTAAYDLATGRLTGIQTTGATETLQNWTYGDYDRVGNVGFRQSVVPVNSTNVTMREAFGYDALYRLTSATRSVNGAQVDVTPFAYDALGNFTQKGNVTHRKRDYVSGTTACARQTVGWHAVTAASGPSGTTYYCYDANGNQTHAGNGQPGSTAPGNRNITYAVHNKPLQIVTTTIEGQPANTTSYRYGPNREVISRSDTPQGGFETKVHHVGSLEAYFLPNEGNATQRREYKRNLGGFLIVNMRTSVVNSQTQRSSDRRYVFQDLLGSTDVLATDTGAVVMRMSFDVWGQRRNADTGQAMTVAQIVSFNSAQTRRGYTGHQHVDQSNLIHMGGRVYDPALGRFLSPDPFVQSPAHSQSFNRYAYVMNNPMNHVDPSGYFSVAVAIATAAITSGVAKIAFEFWGHSSGFRNLYEIATIVSAVYSIGSAFSTLEGAARFYSDPLKSRFLLADNGDTLLQSVQSIGRRIERIPLMPPEVAAGITAGLMAGYEEWSSAPTMPTVHVVADSMEKSQRMIAEMAAYRQADGIAVRNAAISMLPGAGVGGCLANGCTNEEWLFNAVTETPWGKAGRLFRVADEVDPLKQYAQKLAQEGKTPGAVSEMVTRDGKVYYGHSGQGVPNDPRMEAALRLGETEVKDLKPYRGHCSEISCINQALSDGVDVSGSVMRTLQVKGGYGRLPLTFKPACPTCQFVLEQFNISVWKPPVP